VVDIILKIQIERCEFRPMLGAGEHAKRLESLIREVVGHETPRNNARVKYRLLKQIGIMFDKARDELVKNGPEKCTSDVMETTRGVSEESSIFPETKLEGMDPYTCDEETSTQYISAEISRITGLSPSLLEHDSSCGVSWEESIVATLLSMSSDDISVIENLRMVSFSPIFLDLMEVDQMDHWTLKETYEILVAYSFAAATRGFPDSDHRGFPAEFVGLNPHEWSHITSPNSGFVYLQRNSPLSANLLIEELRSRLGQPLERLHFHGTAWEYAMDIWADGIVCSRGSYISDFGPHSFYLCEDFCLAAKFAVQKYRAHAAVLIYAQDWAEMAAADRTLVFDEANIEWQRTVFTCRKPTRRSVNAMKAWHVIQGPINRRVIIRTVDDVTPIVYRGTTPIQIAIRSDTLEGAVDRNLVGIVFLADDCTNADLFPTPIEQTR
jgi:hypothetical protein